MNPQTITVFDRKATSSLRLLRTPFGRSQIKYAMANKAWPFLSRLADFHRQRIIPNTRIAAVVGSLGKTTTTSAVATALGYRRVTKHGANHRSAIARSILGINRRDRYAVIEVGIMYRRRMRKYARLIRPDITVVTTIASDHNETLGTLEVKRYEKGQMVRALKESGVAVLNGDDDNVMWMARKTRARVVTYGLGEQNDVQGSNFELTSPAGSRFTLSVNGMTRDLRVRLLGEHMLYPILAATAVAAAEQLNLDEVIPALEAMPPKARRLEPIPLENGAFIILDDFKCSYEVHMAALDTLERMQAKRKIVVVGIIEDSLTGTSHHLELHKQLGERIAQVASIGIFVLSDTKKVGLYREGARRGGFSDEKIVHLRRWVEAADFLKTELRAGDVVLIKNRGRYHFERIALALRGRTAKCQLELCKAKYVNCGECSMLEKGW
jgi:UDP-N-acetylmuramoyl-tripeptide--D-alanyl-D-alanine ligase